ncbi:MAG TPA: ADOP family duplicated permease [Vicinamibacterales bacterium]|nr:ADOP family duplicated permease [Vicinamibacterales bacterium]
MSNLLNDLRHSVRLLKRTPGFSAIAILVLALGIGANVGVFSVVNTLVLQPRPGRIDSLSTIYNRDRTDQTAYSGFSYPAYVDLRDRTDVFDSVTAQSFTTLGVRDGDVTRQVFAALVSANYFDTMGVALAAGRPFTLDEERGRASTAVAIASYGVWRQHNLDPAFIGSHVRINGTDCAVVGVTPRGFGGVTAFVSPQWFVPIGAYDRIVNELFRDGTHGIRSRATHALMPIAALKAGVTRAAATAQLDTLARQLGATYSSTDKDRTFFAGGLPRMTVSTRPQHDAGVVALATLLTLVALLVLAIACLNLANLLLARGVARRREIAIRQALGSGRARIVQQLVVEGLVLSVIGGAAGLLLGWWTTTALGAWLGSALTLGIDLLVSPSPRLIAAAGAFAVISTILFAVGPAWSLSRPQVTEDLKGDRGGAGRRRGIGPLLVASQLAVSLALVAAAGLFTRGAINVAGIDGGFAMAHELVVGIDAGLAGYDENRTRAVYRTVLERVRGLAGIESASLASSVAFGDFQTSVKVRTRPEDTAIEATSDIVASRYFETLDVRVVRGREFDASEERRRDGPSVPNAIVNAHLAKMLFKDADPLGRSILVQRRPSDPLQAMTIVGVAPDLRVELFEDGPRPHVYSPFGSQFASMMTLHVRTAPSMSDTAALATIQRELRAIDPQLPILSAKTMTVQRDSSVDVWAVHAAATLFGVFGALALVLAAVGVSGLKAYDVSRRTREIGIRMALGATTRSIERMLLEESGRTTAIALVVGALLAAGIGRLASNFLFNVSPFDPTVLTVAAVVLATATTLACYVPARRATRLRPLDALRAE